MNKTGIIIMGLWWLCCMACQDAEKEMFDVNKSGIYFKLENLKKDKTLILRNDTVVYTFAYDDEEKVRQREICVPVELVGFAIGKARNYRIEVEAASNTEEGVDYEPIATEQIFAADKTVDSLRFVWKRNQTMTDEKNGMKKVNIRIVGGSGLTTGVEEKLFVSLQVSDILEKPDWWDGWEAGFGSWHPVKLREWIKIWGREDLDVNPWHISFFSYPQECTAIVKLHTLFETVEFKDENGNRLYVPANIL